MNNTTVLDYRWHGHGARGMPAQRPRAGGGAAAARAPGTGKRSSTRSCLTPPAGCHCEFGQAAIKGADVLTVCWQRRQDVWFSHRGPLQCGFFIRSRHKCVGTMHHHGGRSAGRNEFAAACGSDGTTTGAGSMHVLTRPRRRAMHGAVLLSGLVPVPRGGLSAPSKGEAGSAGDPDLTDT